MQLQKGIFFDNFAPERFSFILFPELKKVIYSEECKLFLDIVKYKISRGEQTVSLECGNNKKEFSKVILEGVLQMKKKIELGQLSSITTYLLMFLKIL